MEKKKYRTFPAPGLLIRKEHFGILLLTGTGERYEVESRHFPLIKKMCSGEVFSPRDAEESDLVLSLLGKKIFQVTLNTHFRLIENPFVSDDCLNFPRTVYWEATNNCNYQCVHCYSSSGGTRSADLPWSVMGRLIKEMSEKGVEFFNIGGGEPLLNKDIYKIIKEATTRGLSVELTTNGSLLDEKARNNLRSAGLKFLQVSLDGASEDVYLSVRKGGDFELVKENIRHAAVDFIVSTCMVVTEKNYKDVDNVIDLSVDLGVKHFRAIPLISVGRGTEGNGLALSRAKLSGVNSLLQKRKMAERKINIQFNENLVKPCVKNISWMPETHFGCSAGRTTVGINFRGDVFPCSYFVSKEMSGGNITKQTLSDIWSNSVVFGRIREIEKLEGDCSRCMHVQICRGGCRAAAYAVSGNIQASDPLCTVFEETC